MAPTLVESDPDAGFNYPYFLATQDVTERVEPVPLLVEPAGVPRPTDDFDSVLETAERTASSGFGRRVAGELDLPFLQPVFPRPRSDPVDWTHYTTSLDRETMQIDDGPLERIDRQLLAMVDDARSRLDDRGIRTREEIALNGFSATGSFVNRFAALHPQRVCSVTAGGLNGMAILPFEAAEIPRQPEKRRLIYPVGVADVADLTGEPFDPAAFRSVDQFYYVGADDDNDTLLYPDAWTGPEERLSAVLVYGEDVHAERFPTTASMYADADVPAVFRIYEGVGHSPDPVFDDVVTFHERSIAGDEVADIRPAVGGTVPE